MKQKRKSGRKLLGFLLTLAMVVGLMPGMGLTVYADGTTYNPASEYHDYENLISTDTEVTISEVSGQTWYVIAYDSSSSTVTLLPKSGFGTYAFNSERLGGNVYANSEIKTYVDGLTGEGQPLAEISSVISDLTLIDTSTAQELSATKRKGAGSSWWLCSQGSSTYSYDAAAYVDRWNNWNVNLYGLVVTNKSGVRPALKLDLSKVMFDSATNTFSVESATKTPATVKTPPTAKALTYTGSAQELVNAGKAEGGEMQYAIGKDATTAPVDGYKASIPTATNAGTYYVWYKAVGDATHSDSNPAVVTITISEETPTEPETDDGKTETEQKGSAPDNEKTSIDNDLTEIREIVSEEASVDDSDTVRLILNTNSVDESSDENKEAVDSIKSKIEADNLNIGSFLDITLSYIVEDANGAKKSSGQLTELNGRSLSVRFPIPSKLQASGRLFRIFRFHNGEVEEVGSGKGEAVILSLDKFSLYAIAYEDGAATEETEESEKKVVKPHTHTYAWDKVEATESQDGELRYQCTECYDILVRVPLSAYYVFNANTVDKINKAKQGETVKITTDRWISFHKMVFDALTARPDVTLEVSFLDGEYKGNRVSFTIPAGADNSDLFTENNFAGFMYLGNKYGLTAEEN